MRGAILAAIIALAGCTNAVQQTSAPQPGRGWSGYASTDAEYQQAAHDADEWCRETYKTGARYVSRRHDTAGEVVIFGCEN